MNIGSSSQISSYIRHLEKIPFVYSVITDTKQESILRMWSTLNSAWPSTAISTLVSFTVTQSFIHINWCFAKCW